MDGACIYLQSQLPPAFLDALEGDRIGSAQLLGEQGDPQLLGRPIEALSSDPNFFNLNQVPQYFLLF